MLAITPEILYIQSRLRAVSSAGRALEWHSRGQRFDPATVHRFRAKYFPTGGSYSFFWQSSMFYVYVLHSDLSEHFYVGHTDDLTRRINEHNSGKSLSTKSGRPWSVVHFETFGSRSAAVRKESSIKKRGIGRYLQGLKTR